MEKLKLAIVGCGFWADYQIAAWLETGKAEIIAVCDKEEKKANQLASKYNIKDVYKNIDELLTQSTPDCIDIITSPETHASLVKTVAAKGIDVICQKPMANDLHSAKSMVKACDEAGIKFFIHENFRWQTPIRKFKELLESNIIGDVFKSRISFCSAFPVFEKQPFLAELEQFIISDVGTHVLDVARFLFGEAYQLFCCTKSVNEGINGEDVATVLIKMKDDSHCNVEMSYASILEKEAFPETLILAEGSLGSIKLEHNHTIKVTTKEGTKTYYPTPKDYAWANPDYALVHSSIVAINQHFSSGLMNGNAVETTGEDNLETLKLVYACYESAANEKLITL